MNGSNIDRALRKIDQALANRVDVTVVQPTKAEIDAAAAWLEAGGWTPDVAGDDFSRAVDAIAMANKRGVGLVVTGPVGCGKTSLVRVAWPSYAFRSMISDCNTIGCKGIIVDDVGSEHRSNDYGVVHEPFADWFCGWYDQPLSDRPRLVITTNLSGEEFVARYGQRIASRIKECCWSLRMTGGDKRKKASAVPTEKDYAQTPAAIEALAEWRGVVRMITPENGYTVPPEIGAFERHVAESMTPKEASAVMRLARIDWAEACKAFGNQRGDVSACWQQCKPGEAGEGEDMETISNADDVQNEM